MPVKPVLVHNFQIFQLGCSVIFLDLQGVSLMGVLGIVWESVAEQCQVSLSIERLLSLV